MGHSGAGSAGSGTAGLGATRAPDEPEGQEPEPASEPEPEAVAQEVREVAEAYETAETDEATGGSEAAGAVADGGVTLEAGLEAILMVVDEPVAEVTLAQVLERPTHEVAAALRRLAAEYTAAGRGFELRDVAGGWRFYTRADCAPLVERFVRDGQQTRLTQAALETLAVVAYRQPVSRARVAAVRGVNSDGVMRTLVARGLVEEAGTDPESQAVLYRTSSYFLERLGLRDLSELPELAPFLPDDVENLEETTK
ncbi:SMC-Scp complex subunit ScpB [Nonomuraea sp. NN258]|nr:SMC-Scp complex subunit ScpB [Nonomuraea antri]